MEESCSSTSTVQLKASPTGNEASTGGWRHVIAADLRRKHPHPEVSAACVSVRTADAVTSGCCSSRHTPTRISHVLLQANNNAKLQVLSSVGGSTRLPVPKVGLRRFVSGTWCHHLSSVTLSASKLGVAPIWSFASQ